MATFGEELKRLAEEQGFATQQELADACGVSQSMIARLYRDMKTNVSAATLYRLCDALGVQSDHFREFLAEEPPKTPPAPKKKPKK